jgi:hypothetical protein
VLPVADRDIRRNPAARSRRLTGVHASRLALVPTALLLGGLALSGCADPAAQPGPAPSASVAAPATATSAPAAPAPASPPSARPASPRPQVTVPPNRPSPRPYATRAGTLTGVVARSGGCTTLDTGKQRYALVGAVADALAVGVKVTVTPDLAAMPATCDPGLPAVLVRAARPA